MSKDAENLTYETLADILIEVLDGMDASEVVYITGLPYERAEEITKVVSKLIQEQH